MHTMGDEGTTSACLCVPPAPLGFLLGTIHGCMGTSIAEAGGLSWVLLCLSYCGLLSRQRQLSQGPFCASRGPLGVEDGGLPCLALLGQGHFAISPYDHGLETAFLPHCPLQKAHFRSHPLQFWVEVRSVFLRQRSWGPRPAGRERSLGRGALLLWGRPGLLPPEPLGRHLLHPQGSRWKQEAGMTSSRVPIHWGQNSPFSLQPHCIVKSGISVTRPSDLVSFA